MSDDSRREEELLAELDELRSRLEAAEARLQVSRREGAAEISQSAAAEELARSILDQAGEAIIVCDERFGIVRASRMAQQLSAGAVYGRSFEESFPLLETATGEKLSLQSCHESSRKNVEVQLPEKEGKVRHFLLNVAPLTASHGGTLGCIVTLTDISNQKEAEEALRKSEQRFRSLFENSLDGVLLTVDDGSILAANPAACAMFGMSVEELCRAGGRGIIDENDPSVVAALEERSRTGKLRTEFTVRRKDGTRFPVDAMSVVVGGEMPFSFVIFRDITERRQVENELRRAKEELEQKVAERTVELTDALGHLGDEMAARLEAMEALQEKERMLVHQGRQAAMGEMIGNIAHQWRQPLNVLALIIQDLQLRSDMGQFSKGHFDASARKALDTIHHLSRTIDDFRNFFRPDKERVRFRVAEVLARTLSLLEQSLGNLRIEVKVEVADDPVSIGYPNEYSQVLLNILQNARDALEARRGSTQRAVTIKVFKEGSKAVITVSDNAGGIPAEIISRVFDPYFTTKGPDKGTGLGLFMSKTIIERNMSGKLTVRNIAEGAEFRIETDEASEAAKEAPATTSPAVESTGEPASEGEKPLRFLVAEDDRIAAILLRQLLELRGIGMDLAQTGAEAVELWEKGEYDLIMMDIQMPRMDGLTATRLIREKELQTGEHIPIIAMTAGGFPEDEEKALAAGMDAYFVKPLDLDKDMEMIRKLLNSSD
ncbi:PAS domain S-box protein [Geobacter sp. DSM 9736]|uniref:PAS domain S-box protein n=1 Tax=Geobacter sp. DSM 9736 TaxID=1277350 RepID=UPI000B5DD804|nr:PAS domain S-box protein [Geobacter sp. DSM 9736]SNB46957.1 PAS domain S-box-containing protein [Geobacter sp. DSM 9736]